MLLFAGLAERLGTRELALDGESGPATVEELERMLRARHEPLAGATFRVAVNRRYVSADAPVRDGDEIALIPPVSGG